jgi:hypothetical protein
VVVWSAAFFSPPQAATTRASPAAKDFMRIALRASRNVDVARTDDTHRPRRVLVNHFTRL